MLPANDRYFDMELMRGSGNVFADFGRADAQAEKLKANLAAGIIAILDSRKLSVRQAGKIAGLDEANIQRIHNADLARISIDRLVRVAARLGCKIELSTRAA